MARALATDAEIAAALAALPRWTREGDELRATYRFATFGAAVAFTQRVAEAAERANHHPEWTVRYRDVDVRTTTHDANGITAADLDLARAIDAAAIALRTEVNSPRAMRGLVAVALLAPWLVAALAWPDLPERIPFHFDLGGRADDWVARSVLTWFMLPALASLLGAVIGIGLPVWIVRMARTKPTWLNVPNRAAFRELPADARERAVKAPAQWLGVLAIVLQVIFVWLLLGMHHVATDQWRVLPPLPALLLIGVLFAIVVAFAVHSHRAVRREVDAARAAAP